MYTAPPRRLARTAPSPRSQSFAWAAVRRRLSDFERAQIGGTPAKAIGHPGKRRLLLSHLDASIRTQFRPPIIFARGWRIADPGALLSPHRSAKAPRGRRRVVRQRHRRLSHQALSLWKFDTANGRSCKLLTRGILGAGSPHWTILQLARRTGRFPQLVDSRSRVNGLLLRGSPGFREVSRIDDPPVHRDASAVWVDRRRGPFISAVGLAARRAPTAASTGASRMRVTSR